MNRSQNRSHVMVASQSSAKRWSLLATMSAFFVAAGLSAAGQTTNTYQCAVPLAPFCLNDSFPVSVTSPAGTVEGTLTTTVDGKGALHGELSIGGHTLAITGKVKFKGDTAQVRLVAADNSERLTLRGGRQGSSIVGTTKGTGNVAPGTGTFTLDLSSASPLVADVNVSLVQGTNGKMSGGGVASICGNEVPVLASGSGGAILKLKLKGTSFAWSCVGTAEQGGKSFRVSWSGKGFGSKTSGSDLLVVQVLESVSQTISAATGGTIILPSGSSIVIPPGMLVGDENVTASVISALPEESTYFDSTIIYESGPAGRVLLVNIGAALPRADMVVDLKIPDDFITSLGGTHIPALYVKGSWHGEDETLDFFELVYSSFDVLRKTLTATIPEWSFRRASSLDAGYLSEILIGSAPSSSQQQSRSPVLAAFAGSLLNSDCRSELYSPLQGLTPEQLKTKISDGWGPRILNGEADFHTGVDFSDIRGPRARNVVAAGSGSIVAIGWSKTSGQTVIVRHEDNSRTLYAHLETGSIRAATNAGIDDYPHALLSDGNSNWAYYEQGIIPVLGGVTLIGVMGNTGSKTTGTHLHFEYSPDGPIVFGDGGTGRRDPVPCITLDPPAGKIIFVTSRDGNSEIYSVDYDGSNTVNLTGDSHKDWLPSQSCLNGKIAFVSDRDGNNEIYTMTMTGADLTRLTSVSSDDITPQWSPEGERIAFVSQRDGNPEIYVMNADGTAQTRLTSNSSDDSQPSWSPDGSKILFISKRDGNNEIYMMNADGTGQVNLTQNAGDDQIPTLSPDGTTIAFVSNRDSDFDLWLMDANGGNLGKLTTDATDSVGWYAWSPDGTRIAFDSLRDGDYEIYVIDADGTNLRQLTVNTVRDVFSSWTCDGSKIAFVSERDGNKEVYLMDPDGGNPVNLSNDPSSDDLPAASPVYQEGGGCFMATAAYGSFLNPHVQALRDFRDRHLLTNVLGRRFVKFYYDNSPPIAEFIRQHVALRTGTRWVLTPIVFSVKYPGAAAGIFVGILISAWMVRIRLKALRLADIETQAS